MTYFVVAAHPQIRRGEASNDPTQTVVRLYAGHLVGARGIEPVYPASQADALPLS